VTLGVPFADVKSLYCRMNFSNVILLVSNTCLSVHLVLELVVRKKVRPPTGDVKPKALANMIIR
jgi:hypothetical protein